MCAAIALAIACDIHPLNNLRVLRYLVKTLGVTEEQKNAWYRHWVEQGLASLEARLVAAASHRPLRTRRSGDARRYHDRAADLQRAAHGLRPSPGGTQLMRIFDNCMQLPAFIDAQPSAQPDAERGFACGQPVG